jgi:hypothetical protein
VYLPCGEHVPSHPFPRGAASNDILVLAGMDTKSISTIGLADVVGFPDMYSSIGKIRGELSALTSSRGRERGGGRSRGRGRGRGRGKGKIGHRRTVSSEEFSEESGVDNQSSGDEHQVPEAGPSTPQPERRSGRVRTRSAKAVDYEFLLDEDIIMEAPTQDV